MRLERPVRPRRTALGRAADAGPASAVPVLTCATSQAPPHRADSIGPGVAAILCLASGESVVTAGAPGRLGAGEELEFIAGLPGPWAGREDLRWPPGPPKGGTLLPGLWLGRALILSIRSVPQAQLVPSSLALAPDCRGPTRWVGVFALRPFKSAPGPTWPVAL